MAFFGVTLETIKSVRPIPNADRIEVASLERIDFDFVIGKGAFRAGDQCLYIPVDSLLPPGLIERLGLTGKLAGPEFNRVKTCVLRGQCSQGLVAPLDIAPPELHRDPDRLTKHLGIVKWDPPLNFTQDGVLQPLRDGMSEYDIEGFQRHPRIVEILMDAPALITEKLEGGNLGVMSQPADDPSAGDELWGACRTNTIIEVPGCENPYWKAARRGKVIEAVRAMCRKLSTKVVVYAEAIGPGISAGNYYGLAETTAKAFDIRINHRWLPPGEFLEEAENYGIATVPVISNGVTLRSWLAGRTIKEAADGDSILSPGKRREGIVVRPMLEERIDGFGRLILKGPSLAYLAKAG